MAVEAELNIEDRTHCCAVEACQKYDLLMHVCNFHHEN
jgi:hypothetical protein